MFNHLGTQQSRKKRLSCQSKVSTKSTQDTFLINQFNEMSENPKYWHNKAAELFTSAGVIWKAMNSGKGLYAQCDATYKMLMGMSFEALLKGLCIENGKVTTADLIGHDLVKISKINNHRQSRGYDESP